jgi:hypothetical protein
VEVRRTIARRQGFTGAAFLSGMIMRKLVFTAFLVLCALALWYGISAGDFLETLSNGVTICLTCIGVA